MRFVVCLLRVGPSRSFNIGLKRSFSTAPPFASGPQEHRVLLDNNTLYIQKELAEALGWKPDHGVDGLRLSLHGWKPSYFTITPSGTDSEWLARGTVESSRNPNVKKVIDYLKDR